MRIPTITDPRGVDFRVYKRLGQQQWMADLEGTRHRRFRGAWHSHDQYVHQLSDDHAASLGEHMAYGDTGVVIYSNSVLGARSNFRGRAIGAGCGPDRRAPRYGFHLDKNRRGTHRYIIDLSRKTGATGAPSVA